MKRREFLKVGAIGGLVSAAQFPKPAIASKVIDLRMVTAWPKNILGSGQSAANLASYIHDLSGGTLRIKVFSSGELYRYDEVFEAVSSGEVEMFHASPCHHRDKNRFISFFGSQPFGLNAEQQAGWMRYGGGQALYDKMYAQYNLKPYLSGSLGSQWAGWFKEEIHSLDDVQGLRFRTSGLALDVANLVGFDAQFMDGISMFQALQTDLLDGGEYAGPAIDQAMGFHLLAKNYYWPGVSEPSVAEECVINLDFFHSLSKGHQAIIANAAIIQYNNSLSKFTLKHNRALRNMVKNFNVKTRRLPKDIIDALSQETVNLYREMLENGNEFERRLLRSYIKYNDFTAQYKRNDYSNIIS